MVSNSSLVEHKEIVDARHLLRRNEEYKWKQRDPEKITGLVWHQALGWGTVEDVAEYHCGPNHMSQKGLPGIAYTFAIRRDGEILLCNDIEDRTWSQGTREREGDENAEFASCMFEGRFWARDVNDANVGEPTPEQIMSGLRLWQICVDVFGWDKVSSLFGHFDFGKEACPGYTLQQIILAVRRPEPLADKDNVMWVQKKLKQLGHYTGEIDGLWGPLSKRAVVEFQQQNDLEATGVVNVPTHGKLSYLSSGAGGIDNRGAR